MASDDKKKEKYRRFKRESGIYQIDGLTGYFTYQNFLDSEGDSKALSSPISITGEHMVLKDFTFLQARIKLVLISIMKDFPF